MKAWITALVAALLLSACSSGTPAAEAPEQQVAYEYPSDWPSVINVPSYFRLSDEPYSGDDGLGRYAINAQWEFDAPGQKAYDDVYQMLMDAGFQTFNFSGSPDFTPGQTPPMNLNLFHPERPLKATLWDSDLSDGTIRMEVFLLDVDPSEGDTGGSTGLDPNFPCDVAKVTIDAGEASETLKQNYALNCS